MANKRNSSLNPKVEREILNGFAAELYPHLPRWVGRILMRFTERKEVETYGTTRHRPHTPNVRVSPAQQEALSITDVANFGLMAVYVYSPGSERLTGVFNRHPSTDKDLDRRNIVAGEVKLVTDDNGKQIGEQRTYTNTVSGQTWTVTTHRVASNNTYAGTGILYKDRDGGDASAYFDVTERSITGEGGVINDVPVSPRDVFIQLGSATTGFTYKPGL